MAKSRKSKAAVLEAVANPQEVQMVDQVLAGTEAAVLEDVEAARSVISAEEVYNLSSDQINTAIADGDIRWNGGSPGERIEAKDGTVTWVGAKVGDPVSSVTDVTISAEKSPTHKDEIQPYQKLEAVTFEGMVLLAGGKAEPAVLRGEAKLDPRSTIERIKGAADHFNYGLDLEVKRNLRKDLERGISGPEKEILKMAKVLHASRKAKYPTLEAAIAKIRADYFEDETEAAS